MLKPTHYGYSVGMFIVRDGKLIGKMPGFSRLYEVYKDRDGSEHFSEELKAELETKLG